MLQRIQTVYLLIITALMAAVLFLPLAAMQTADAVYSFDVTGLNTVAAQPELVYPTWALLALNAVVIMLALVTIFLYKNRILQIRLSVFNTILMICFYGLFAFFVWTIQGEMSANFSVKMALSFPLISLVLNYLAIRSIGADEVLVRSLDRLR